MRRFIICVCTGESLLTNLQETEQFVFTNIARTNKLRLPIHLMNTEPRPYKHFNTLTLTNLTIYLAWEKNLTYEH
jgi:hypothetical protein